MCLNDGRDQLTAVNIYVYVCVYARNVKKREFLERDVYFHTSRSKNDRRGDKQQKQQYLNTMGVDM